MTDTYVEKKILEELVPKFESVMARKMMVNSIELMDEMKEFAVSPGDFNIQIKTIKENSCFRIRFAFPTYLLFHIASNNLFRVHKYFKTFPMASIPAYNLNLNHLTLLRVYSKTQEWMDKLSSLRDEDTDWFCKKFTNDKGEPMEQSSLNFLLQNNSKSSDVSQESSNVIEKAFETLYWRLPTKDLRFRYSTIHNFVYHSSDRVFSAHRIFKTLIKIIDIGNKKYSMGYPKRISYVHAEGYVLCQNENNVFFQKTKLLISEPDASRIKPDMMVSAIFDKPILYKQSNQPFIMHGIVGGEIKQGDYKQIISILLWKQLHKITGDLCKVEKTEQLKNKMQNIINKNPHIFEQVQPKDFENKFSKSIKDLSPLILEHDESVFHVPAPLLSYILSTEQKILENKKDLVNLLKLIDHSNPKTNFGSLMNLRTSSMGKEVQAGMYGKHWNSLLSNINRISNRIVYSKVFSKSSFMSV